MDARRISSLQSSSLQPIMIAITLVPSFNNHLSFTAQVKDIHEGIDFYYAQRGHALKFVDFLQSVVPIRFRADKQLVSHDTKSNTYNYKFTFSVEIVPLCKVRI